MRFIQNIKISTKLILLVTVGLLQLVAVTAVSVWAVHSIQDASREMRGEYEKTTLALRTGTNVTRAALIVGQLLASSQESQNLSSDLQTARNEYLAAIQELKSKATTEDGRRMLAAIDQSSTQWRAANDQARQLQRAGKSKEAQAMYRDRSMPSFAAVMQSINDFTRWREKRVGDAVNRSETLASQMTRTSIAIGLIALVLCSLFGWIIQRSIALPLASAVSQIGAVAEGDITKDVAAEHLERGDEFGEMSRSVKTMSGNLRAMVKEIASGVRVLSTSSMELSAHSIQMTEGAKNASTKAHSVAAAAEQMSANSTAVAASIEETATNLSHVSTATEQMTSTIGEIAGNSEKARRITTEARREAEEITKQMSQLGRAAQEIGKVTETITEISAQTNLLALNATIEAARAGANGKGFAVVANEIKTLAQQTAGATEDIKVRIAGVQSSTTAGIVQIEKISQVIHEVSEIVSSIATAIEEQSTATKDIAQNIGQASTGVAEANSQVAQTSQASKEVAQDIISVDGSARDLAEGSEQLNSSSNELNKVAEQLRKAVSRFRTDDSQTGQAKLSDGTCEMLRHAIQAHAGWRAKLRSAVHSGKLDVAIATVRVDNQCDFGKWIHGSSMDRSMTQDEHYGKLKRLHAQFHEEAARVAELAVSGQRSSAEEALAPNSAFTRISNDLAHMIEEWCSMV